MLSIDFLNDSVQIRIASTVDYDVQKSNVVILWMISDKLYWLKDLYYDFLKNFDSASVIEINLYFQVFQDNLFCIFWRNFCFF